MSADHVIRGQKIKLMLDMLHLIAPSVKYVYGVRVMKRTLMEMPSAEHAEAICDANFPTINAMYMVQLVEHSCMRNAPRDRSRRNLSGGVENILDDLVWPHVSVVLTT